MDEVTKRQPIIDPNRYSIGFRFTATIAVLGLYDQKQQSRQTSLQDLLCYQELFDVAYAMATQLEGGVNLGLASSGGELDSFEWNLFQVSADDALGLVEANLVNPAVLQAAA